MAEHTEEIEHEDICGETYDHDTETTYEDEDGYQWECRRCGAEGWHEAALSDSKEADRG